MSSERHARQIFGQRASYYATSAAHTDSQVLGEVLRLAAPQRDWLGIDVGTGTGHTALALAPHVSVMVGVDFTPQMLAEATTLALEQDIHNVRWHLADAHALPYAAASFELLTCRRAAHHFAHIRRALSEMRRVLLPDGRLVIDDRSVPEDDAIDDIMHQLDLLHDPSHVRQYRPSVWRRLLQQAGFAIDEVIPYTKHRPLSSLTQPVAEENVHRIRAIVEAAKGDTREKMGLETIDGELYLNHWYVMLAAHRAP